jgi:hypothetical protein
MLMLTEGLAYQSLESIALYSISILARDSQTQLSRATRIAPAKHLHDEQLSLTALPGSADQSKVRAFEDATALGKAFGAGASHMTQSWRGRMPGGFRLVVL